MLRKSLWWRRATAAIGIFVLFLSFGCSGGGGTDPATKSSPSPAARNPINPNMLKQFTNPLIQIPAAPVDPNNPTSYTVTARQKTDWDFGLLNTDGSAIMDPTTGKPIKSTTWGYDVNGLFLGIYAPTIEARTGVPIKVKYVNDLRDDSGKYLTKHILPIDTTIHGANMGEPEVRIVGHLHGGHVDAEFDGHPEAWFTNDPAVQALWALPADPSRGRPARPATNFVNYSYRNDQPAATLWFHDHALGITRLNPYVGLAGFYLLRDAIEDSLNLPKGNYEVPVVLQDKNFYADGSLAFNTLPNLSTIDFTPMHDKNGNIIPSVKPEFFGNVIVVNGKAWPYFDVEPRRYRFRFVNGADSRMFNLWFQDAQTGLPITKNSLNPGESWPVVQIAAEQGFANNAVEVATGSGPKGLLIGNGERADIVIDFSHRIFKNKSVLLRNDAPAPFSGVFGPDAEDPTTLDPKTTGKVMKFNVKKPLAGEDTSATIASLKASLKNFIGLPESESADHIDKIRYIDLQERNELQSAIFDPLTDQAVYRMQLLLNGLRFDDPITEKPVMNTIEDWVFVNTTPDVHPMHLHQVAFQVVEKGYLKTDGTDGNYVRADGAGMMPQVNEDALIPNAEPGGDEDSAPAGSLYAIAPNEIKVWKDTVKVPPAETPGPGTVVNPGYVRVRARFDILGAYMYHCHILSHEENEMMRPFLVVATPQEAVVTNKKGDFFLNRFLGKK
ncbi:MAG: multicopper oxidase domain-containing protein [Thermodesulfovibrionales bacterium]